MIVMVVVEALKSSSRNVGKKSCVPWLMKLNAAISPTRYTKRRSVRPWRKTSRQPVCVRRSCSTVRCQASDSPTRMRMKSASSAGIAPAKKQRGANGPRRQRQRRRDRNGGLRRPELLRHVGDDEDEQEVV